MQLLAYLHNTDSYYLYHCFSFSFTNTCTHRRICAWCSNRTALLTVSRVSFLRSLVWAPFTACQSLQTWQNLAWLKLASFLPCNNEEEHWKWCGNGLGMLEAVVWEWHGHPFTERLMRMVSRESCKADRKRVIWRVNVFLIKPKFSGSQENQKKRPNIYLFFFFLFFSFFQTKP